MYVNYLYFKFKENQNLCTDVTIWVPTLNKFINAPACSCFGRTKVLPFECSEETFRSHQELSFYPLNSERVAVYKINFPGPYYTLLTIDRINWRNVIHNQVDLFTTKVPVSYSEIVDLHRMLDPFIPQLEDLR